MSAHEKSASTREIRSQSNHSDEYKPILRELSSDSHCKKVLLYMIKHGSITQDEARVELNCGRLASRIFDLRDLGIIITTLRVENLGNSGTHAKYILEGVEE